MTLPTINNLGTTLTVAVLVGDTTLNVASTTGWPSTGVCSIEDEVISYTGKTGVTFTGCTRGYDGTTAASHALVTSVGDAMPVELRIIAEHISEIHDELDLLSPTYQALYNSAAAIDFLVIPANYRLEDVEVMMVTPYDATGCAISIGTSGDPTLYMASSDVDLTESNGTFFCKKVNAVGPITVRLTTTAGTGGSAGEALIILKLVAP